MYKKFYLNEEKNQAIQDWGDSLTYAQVTVILLTKRDFYIEVQDVKGDVEIKFDNDL